MLQTITQVFSDKQLKLLDSYFDDCQEQLENSTTFLNQVDFLKTLKGELVQLSKLMDGLQDKTLDAEKNAIELHKQFRSISEDTQAFVWDTIYEINIHALKHPSHYLKEQSGAIRHEFSRKRVRKVHYRNQPVWTLKTYDDGIVKYLAYCSDKDFALEALQVPQDYSDFDKAQLLYNKIGAQSDLIFSKYFVNYLGFDD